MVQLYNPNIVGKHILVDIKNISSDKLKLIEDVKPFLDKLVEELKLNVVGESAHINLKNLILPMVLPWFIYYLKVIYQFIHLLMKGK